MPKNHARKEALAFLKSHLGIKHDFAVALLNHRPVEERELLLSFVEDVYGLNTYAKAVAHLREHQNDPANKVLCENCGWTYGMMCPECGKGCGCETSCTGWRHAEMRASSADDDYDGYDDDECCAECGGSDRFYVDCVCDVDPYGCARGAGGVVRSGVPADPVR
ncbi:hypothetical protein AB0O47_40515, partial [Streptomyces noursei]|uniref:hypothetical protein n=1 Tax=Streptomyces noursei TaxID=1971 RepID=UPI00344B4857